ncbi:MAG: transketolase C-terminal domain-containing protein [Candidatus Omnitrophota bacterium]|jgi:transketolase
MTAGMKGPAGSKATRDGFGEALLQLGRENKDIVVLSGDLEDSTRAEYFKKEFPERFFNLGIAEQDIAGTAAGLSKVGLVPFICSFAAFWANAFGVFRVSVCYNNCNVKIVGTHSGISVGPDGATAQALEDIAAMTALPNMSVVCPADAAEAEKATRAIAAIDGPIYLRLGREAVPSVTDKEKPFIFGKACVLKDGAGAAIIACGHMVSESLKAAEKLSKEGIEARVINMHTIKPIDREEVVKAAKEAGAIVTAEEHQVNGGLGSAVAGVLACECPVPLEMVAVRDAFGESGEGEELLKKYNLKEDDIIKAVKRAVSRKNGGG